MDRKELWNLIIRYFILLILPINGLIIIYGITRPLTVYPVLWVLSLFYSDASLLASDIIDFAGVQAHIIPACLAGAAYYLLLILNLTTPIALKKRIKSIIFMLALFLLVNIGRISLFAHLYVTGYSFFDLTHKITWYLGSTVLVVLIWFLTIKKFKITNIPIYTDFKNIYLDTKKKPNKTKK